jgi:hypothetical protein
MPRVTTKPIDVHLAEAASRRSPSPSRGRAGTSAAGRVLPHPQLQRSAGSPGLDRLLAGRARPPAAGGREEVRLSMPDNVAAPVAALQFNIEPFLGGDAQPWFSPQSRAVLNTGGVELFKGLVNAGIGWGLNSLIANSNPEKSDDPTSAHTYAIAAATAAGAIGVTQLAMTIGKLAVSHCTYGDPAAENDTTSATTVARACTSANTRHVLSLMSGVAGGALALAGKSPIATAVAAQAILAPVASSLVGALFDYAIKPHVTTYKTDSSVWSQGAMAIAKLPANLFDLGGPGSIGPVVNLFTRAFATPVLSTISSMGGTKGEIVEPGPRKPLSEVVPAEIGKAIASAGAGAVVATVKGAIDLCSSAKPSNDNFAVADLGKNAADFVNKVGKPIVDKQVTSERERRNEIRSQAEALRAENVDARENSEHRLTISEV